ncbi:LOW QUALITY PROTEIN: hypothetical protein OSB04_020600 [Centaurea solstitialis]|uniref:Glutathione S-transferase n=1 Tax=Centaurea solstitialis TaxID=347529 RepID=A0AA38W608_9ASTR|nr:LOW QUALITY PROTEIN: hypothetical protein OSB04_020600 [Centaurea solstitialis]
MQGKSKQYWLNLVLVHNRNPISESLVIVEYIDDVWKQVPVLPQDPYQKVVARFWAKFIDEKCLPSLHKVFGKNGSEQVVTTACTYLKMNWERKVTSSLEVTTSIWSILLLLIGFHCWKKQPKSRSLQKISFGKWGDEFVNCEVVKEILPPRDMVLAYYKERFCKK